MIYLQIAANGLVLGGLYACIAVGFSLVWGVLNVINILHGSFIVLGSYVAYFAYVHLGIHPFISIVIAGGVLYALGYVLQAGIINRVVSSAGADHADADVRPRSHPQQRDAGGVHRRLSEASRSRIRSASLEIGPVFLPGDRVAAMALALLLTMLLYRLLRDSRIGRAIVAVRMDREAAALMGVDVKRINAITFAHRRVHGGRGRRAAQHHLSDLAAQRPAVPRQGLRGLRARRPRQRAGRAGRRPAARRDRELQLATGSARNTR